MNQPGPIAGGCRIGPKLGVGGMAVVYEATHVASGETVAIKLIQRALGERVRDRFAREVRAIARLDHPGIVGTLDAGELERQLTVDDRSFAKGAPFLVMQHAGEGVFSTGSVESWHDTRRVLLQILDALAHAHALGIVHRDIKPANILVNGGRCMLSDFGIVRLGEGSVAIDEKRLVGTPAYMAPEQVRGQVRAQGPWTDLYSLGVVAWDMVVGHRPFEGNQKALLAAHLDDPLPPLAPRFPVPEGLEEWLGVMLAKQPRNRFQRAADAAAALNSLGEPTVPGVASKRAANAVETNTLLPTEMNTIHSLDWHRDGESTASPGQDRPTVVISDVPEAWQRPGTGNRRGVANAGLGLFGLRSIPMVDRESERTEMWDHFAGCAREREPRCVLLHGPSGVGKSRLAEWLVRRAHELGCAEVLHATQTDQDRANGGLAQMLTRFFETRGLKGDVATSRVCASLAHHRYHSPLDAETFTNMVSGGSPKGSQPLIMESNIDAQRFDAVARLLTHLASVRPVVVWVDDPHPEGDVARFVAEALEGAVSGPVLFVLTHRSGADRPFPTYEAAEQNGRMKRLEIRPLSPTYVRALAATTLGLGPPLSDVVAANAGGMPLAAIQMIADWVERRDLVVGPAGYQLREGSAERGGMHTLTDVWVARLENTYRVAGFTRERGHHAMTIGALLGRRINFHAWSVATGFPEPELHALGRALKIAGLATASRRGILLSFENLRQALIDEQADPERVRRNHLACAEALRRSRDVDDDAMRLQQVARHFEQAGEHVEALSPMFDAIELYLERFETARAAELVRSAKAILDTINAAGDSQQVLRAQLFEATIRYLEKQFDEAQAIARSCLERAEQAGHKELTARSLLSLSHAMFKSSIASMNERGDEAAAYGQRATDLFLELGMEQDASRAQLACAYALLQSGRAEPAAESAKLSAELASGDVLGGALAHYMLGTLERARGNDDEALERFEEAIELALEGGVRLLLAGAYNGRGDILRFRGQHPEALRAYEDAVLLWENLGSSNVQTARMNAALANIAMGNYPAAKAILMTILGQTEGTEKGYESVFAATFILPCLAADAEHATYDDYWVESTQAIGELGIVDRDIMTHFELVARLWREHGDHIRADAAAAVAESQREQLAAVA